MLGAGSVSIAMNTLAGRCRGCFEVHTIAGACANCGYRDDAPRSPRELPPGTVLHGDQFLIGRVLGSAGGFGITYLALDQTLSVRVAIKEFFPRHLVGRAAGAPAVVVDADDQSVFDVTLRRFLDEARRVAKFHDHPHIVRVRHFFEQHGTGYMVMDYYEGQSLEQYATGPDGEPRRLHEREALDIMLPVLDGLQEVHDHDLLHRDIKPANIYLARRKQRTVPLLIDFGSSREFAVSRTGKRWTRELTGGFAPWEQYLERGPQGPWTDIYACAAALYLLTTGKVPPDGLERKEEEDTLVAPEQLRPDLSPQFCAAITRALSVNHKDRPQTAAAFRGLLEAAFKAAAPPPASGTKHRPRPHWTELTRLSRFGSEREYSIVRELAEGSMSICYLARRLDAYTDTDAALLIFNPDLLSRSAHWEAFYQRARPLLGLRHPNVPRALACGSEDDDLVYADMDFVDGRPLMEVLRSGRVPITQAVRIGIEVASALAAAHARGIVHRKLHPFNVLVGGAGHSTVIGWWSGFQTPTGVPVRPPEMIRDPGVVDPRADLFSLGVLLYGTLAGKRPFAGAGLDLARAILDDAPAPLTQLRSDIPPDLAKVIHRLLEKDPARRYQAAVDVEAALSAIEKTLVDPTGQIRALAAVGSDADAIVVLRNVDPLAAWDRQLITAQSMIEASRFAEAAEFLQSELRRHELETGAPGVAKRRHLTYALLGTAYCRAGNYTKAIDATEKAKELCPPDKSNNIAIHDANIARMAGASVWLAVPHAGDDYQLVEIERPASVVGKRREPGVIVVDDDSIGERHFELQRGEDDAIIMRAMPDEPVRVNGQRVDSLLTALSPNSRIRAGRVELQLVSKASESLQIKVGTVHPHGALQPVRPPAVPWPTGTDAAITLVIVLGKVPVLSDEAPKVIRDLLKKGVKRLVVDFSRALMHAPHAETHVVGPWLDAQSVGAQLRVWQPPAVVRERLKAARHDRIIPIYDVEPWTVA